MKKRFKNILIKKGKKNGISILICAVILTISLGTLVGCSVAKEDTKGVSGQSGSEKLQFEESSLKNFNNSLKAEQSSNDYSVMIGDLTIALYEDKQDITDKLNETDQSYNEYDSDMKYFGSDYNKYDSYYMVGESMLGTDESEWAAGFLCVYFKDSRCVRLSLLNEVPKTSRGVHIGGSYSQLIEEYGDSFEKHTYTAHGVYDVYRYSANDSICEFGILEDYPDSVCNVDIYVPSLYPIYDYGEELTPKDMEHREIRDIVYEFSSAYFDGNADAIQKFLSSTYEGEIRTYEGTGTISDITVKGLSDADEQKTGNGTYIVSLEFRDSDMEDTFRYLTIEFTKQEGGWKIQFYGLEG